MASSPSPSSSARALESFGRRLADRLDRDGVVVLEPMDVSDTLRLWAMLGGLKNDAEAAATSGPLDATCVMLDPWYNKGVGGERDDYVDYVKGLLTAAGRVAPHVYLWGFPEIIARFVDVLPEPLALEAWLTWFYKNNPSVIRGWRSAQMTCL